MIPAFNAAGVLPPFVGDNPGPRAYMSPYRSNLLDMAVRLGSSSERGELLLGLLSYRAALKDAGVKAGFQWIDGSFVEDSESILRRPPADIDVVTFTKFPGSAQSFRREHPHLFDPRQTKARFRCDAYFVDLCEDSAKLIDDTRYWLGLLSHQRETQVWKGMLQVELDDKDRETRQFLAARGVVSRALE